MLEIGIYKDNQFEFNPELDHDFLDNPDFVESLDKRFVHNELGLYFDGAEEEYRKVIEKSIIEWENYLRLFKII